MTKKHRNQFEMKLCFHRSFSLASNFVVLVAKVLVLIFSIFTSVLANIYRRRRAPWVYVKLSIETSKYRDMLLTDELTKHNLDILSVQLPY